MRNRNNIVTILAIVIILAFFIGTMAVMSKAEAFNMTLFDTTYNFDKAQIQLPDGQIITGEVESWTDWETSDAIQVKINGVTYYTHLSRVVLIAK